MRNTHIIIYFVAMLALMGCKKGWLRPKLDTVPTELPNVSTAGKGTFGCLVDGDLWVADYCPSLVTLGPPTVRHDIEGNLEIFAYREICDSMYSQSITIYGLKPTLSDTIFLGSRTSSLVLDNYGYARYTGECISETDDDHTGRLLFLKFDTVNFIYSGVFECTLVTEDGESIEITEGRFDLKI